MGLTESVGRRGPGEARPWPPGGRGSWLSLRVECSRRFALMSTNDLSKVLWGLIGWRTFPARPPGRKLFATRHCWLFQDATKGGLLFSTAKTSFDSASDMKRCKMNSRIIT
jgi:hypothetical protein